MLFTLFLRNKSMLILTQSPHNAVAIIMNCVHSSLSSWPHSEFTTTNAKTGGLSLLWREFTNFLAHHGRKLHPVWMQLDICDNLSGFQFSLRPLYTAWDDYRFSVCACCKPIQLEGEKQRLFTSLFARAKISLHSIYQLCFCILKKIQNKGLRFIRFVEVYPITSLLCQELYITKHFRTLSTERYKTIKNFLSVLYHKTSGI